MQYRPAIPLETPGDDPSPCSVSDDTALAIASSRCCMWAICEERSSSAHYAPETTPALSRPDIFLGQTAPFGRHLQTGPTVANILQNHSIGYGVACLPRTSCRSPQHRELLFLLLLNTAVSGTFLPCERRRFGLHHLSLISTHSCLSIAPGIAIPWIQTTSPIEHPQSLAVFCQDIIGIHFTLRTRVPDSSLNLVPRHIWKRNRIAPHTTRLSQV